ncbi:MAG: type III PLP-dependent enzyme, partial [Maritimibacter sp.]
SPEGEPRQGPVSQREIYGPTCDSVDRLPDPLPIPGDVAEGDYLIFAGMGAYSNATLTRFNGYGAHEIVTLHETMLQAAAE